MDNRKGKSNVAVGSFGNTGEGTTANIGLLELKFDNRGGNRAINLKKGSLSGTQSKFNIGQKDMDNRGGKSDIGVGSMSAGGT